MYGRKRKYTRSAKRYSRPSRGPTRARRGTKSRSRGTRKGMSSSKTGLLRTDQRLCKLKHTVQVNVGTYAGGAAATALMWKGNSLYRPSANQGDTTTMVNGYTLLFSQYRQCTVHASKIVIKPIVCAGSMPITYTLRPVRGGTIAGPTDAFIARSLPYAKHITAANMSTGANPRILKSFIGGRKILGISKIQYGASQQYMMSTLATDPTQPWHWELAVTTADATTLLNANVNLLEVDITYFCQFSDAIDIITEA